MVPGTIVGIASDTCGMPLLPGVVPDIPVMASPQSALMSPNIGLSVHKLIDVKLQRLRRGNIVAVEIRVINEIVNSRQLRDSDSLSLRGKVANQVVVPQPVRELRFAANAKPSCISTPRRRTHSLLTRSFAARSHCKRSRSSKTVVEGRIRSTLLLQAGKAHARSTSRPKLPALVGPR
jgi:hypothetical protein